MRSLRRLAVAVGLTALVALAVPLTIALLVAGNDRPTPPGLVIDLATAEAQGPDVPTSPESAQAPCRVTLQPGDDIGAAVAAQPIDGVVCLVRGVHRPFVVARSTSAGVTVRGEGPETTTILAQRADAVAISDAERFTLANLAVRGGTPAAVYATRARGLALRGVRIQGGSFGLHADDGSTVTLDDVTASGAADFGLLVRRRSSVSGEAVRVLESRAIAIGVVDEAAGLTLRGGEIARSTPGTGEGLVAIDAGRVSLDDLVVRGGDPAALYFARVPEARLRGVTVEGARFAVHADDMTAATLEDVTLTGSTGVGLLLQRGASVSGERVRVRDTAGTGVSAINGAAALALRDSEVSGTAAAGIFAGAAGCGELPPGSLFVPPCFYVDLTAFVAATAVTLERVAVRDTDGPGVVLFPGVRATVSESTFERCAYTGLFAWGATADVADSTFADNGEHALEYRAYPDPRQPDEVVAPGGGTLARATVAGTRPLPSGALGGGVLAQGSDLSVDESTVRANRAIGVSYQNGARGAVTASRILNNGGIGLCLAPGTAVTVTETVIGGNALDGANACGGLR